MKKLCAWLGIISILWTDIAFAMLPQKGTLVIHGDSVSLVGTPPVRPVIQDISSVIYEDFDVTAFSSGRFAMDAHRYVGEERKAQALHFDTNIPFIGGEHPTVDYKALRLLPLFIAEKLQDKVHPKIQSGALKFVQMLARNEATLDPTTQIIPDMDCLYYKMVGDQQHLFLRLSSQIRQEAETFKLASSGKTLFVESGEVRLLAERDMVLDHIVADADNISCIAGQTIFNRASKMKAKWVIRLKAGKQRHETVINKWVREDRGKHHFTHAEGVESIDDCSFVARKVIQEGDEVENFGIFVEADEFEDRAIRTVSMPAKITLFNYAWAENEDLFSSASSSVTKRDDVLVPTRYHVNYYRSLPGEDGRETSVRFGYTIINSGSRIEVLKDVKEDVVVEEKHTIEIHEEKSGFSICGGVSVPDPTLQLQKMHSSYRSKNMMGLTTSAISAVAKGIRAYEDYKVAKELVISSSLWNLNSTVALLQTLSHYVNGPSVQFGSRSVDIMQEQVLSHGNTFMSPVQVFHNPRLSSFVGTYQGEDIDIKTKTFITFDLPQTTHSTMSVHQSGVSLDLLSFGIALMNPAIGSTIAAALAASSVNVSFQDTETHQTVYLPTTMQASRSLKIEAEDGILTQAQIKAGLVHAIFTRDCLIETLASKKWSKSGGGGLSVGLGAFAGDFKGMADTLIDMAASANITHIDAGSFEKVIDDFAAFVGEDEFYLEVGNVLHTKSAILGHATGDKSKEHIESRERIDERVEEVSHSYDRSFDLNVGDFVTVGKALVTAIDNLKTEVFEESLEHGMQNAEATEIARKTEADLNEVAREVATTEATFKEIDQQAKTEVQGKVVEVAETASVSEKRRAERENLNAITTTVRKSAQEKMRVVDAKIKAIEAKKTELSAQLRHTPNANESVATVLDSLIDGLKSARNALVYVVKNPLEAANRAYQVYDRFMDKAADRTADEILALGRGIGCGVRFIADHSIGETYDLVTARLSRMYHEADFRTTGLDLAEYAPIGIGATVEGGRDIYGIYVSGDRELRPVVDKWRNYGIIAAIGGKSLKRVAAEVVETATDLAKITARKGLHPLVKPIGGRMPINAEYAGKMFDMSKLSRELQMKYPHGVHFTASGFPDFSRYSKRKVEIRVSGTNIDHDLADKAAGFVGANKRPAGYTWHHHEDGKSMLLVPKDLHEKVRHTGGSAVINAVKK